MYSETQRYSTGNPYEARFGYSRAVRKGPFIFVSGTTSVSAKTGELQHADGTAYDQAKTAFDELLQAVHHLGGRKEDTVRVRMFVTKDEDAEDVGRALKDSLGEVAPAATMILGARFVDPRMKVEIELEAVVL